MRRETVTVMVGELAMGSAFPVRVQSMLDASTMDTEACVAQAARVVEAGGELVRLAVPGVREAVNLGTIREAWRGLGYRVPLSADVHFSPEVAMVAARSADKVRVNPGNFPGGNDEDFEAGARRAREGFSRFLSCCRERGVAVRVGTNHGSLSGRITRRFGNTPEGMVEATMEFLRACAEEGFGEVVVSLKSSDCRVMVEAVRLLARRMEGEGMAFPLHLGVTEAGEGEDGRARSAVGIGTLLNEGLGDTIRVSLTEPPEREVAVARELIGCCRPLFRRDRRVLSPRCARPLVVGSGEAEAVVVPGGGAVVVEGVSLPVVGAGEFRGRPMEGCWVEVRSEGELDEELVGLLAGRPGAWLVFCPPSPGYEVFRGLFERLEEAGLGNAAVVRVEDEGLSDVALAAMVGGLFLDRLPAGLWAKGGREALCRGVLQSAGARRYRTEFVSCPGCGRTLFDLQASTREVKRVLSGFPRLKIAVMGCVVNGPGEMGDADYGYVGAGRGLVTLYKGGRVARREVPEGEAVEALRRLVMEGEG